MTFEDYRADHFYKIQKQIVNICWIGTIMAFLTELIIFFANIKFGYLLGSASVYILIRIVLPTTINLVTAITCSVICLNKKRSDKFRNYTASFALLLCGTTLACVHSYYSFLVFCILLPMLACTIFASRKLLKTIEVASVFSTIITSVVYYFEHTEYAVFYRFISLLCLWTLFVLCCILSITLVKSQAKQIDFIFTNCKQQSHLIEELKIEPMTGLYNKSCFESCLITYCEKYHQKLFNPTCCIIDIDYFKKINDTYGHAEGDQVLKNLANIIKIHMGGIRKAFRFGGEEFVILWENESMDAIYKKVCDIKYDFSSLKYDFAPDQSFTFSAGICRLDDYMTSDSWFKNADDTLYKAKMDGRDRIYKFEG